MALARNYFDEKGRRAEAVIHALATKTFLTDWCYPNPKKPDGKELCDLLVVFDDIAIIWQVKDLKVDDSGQYKKAEVEKNLRQLSGARRHLFDLKVPIELDNPRRGRELFKPADIRVIHLISVLMGEGEGLFPFAEFLKDQHIHVFTRDFSGLILSELDTVSDFCEYLRKKEAIYIGGRGESSSKVLATRAQLLVDGQVRQHPHRRYRLASFLARSAVSCEEARRRNQLRMGQYYRPCSRRFVSGLRASCTRARPT